MYQIRFILTLLNVLFLILLIPQISMGRVDLQREGQESGPKWLKAWEKVQVTKSYRSAGKLHKCYVAKDNEAQMKLANEMTTSQKFDYNGKQLIVVEDKELQKLSLDEQSLLNVRDDMNVIMLRDRMIDTTLPEPAVRMDLSFVPTESTQLQIVQFPGPVKDEWLNELKALGNVKIVTYLPNNAYLLWIDGQKLNQINTLKAGRNFVQWLSPFHPAFKIHPSFVLGFDGNVNATIQLVTHNEVNKSIATIKSKSSKVLRDTYKVGVYTNIIIELPASELVNISKLQDVVNIEPWIEPQLFGERQGQILANQLDPTGNQPTGPGYLEWLNGLGFNGTFDFVVNVTDSGFDRGQTNASNLHQDFQDADGNSRVEYVQQVSGTTISETANNNIDVDGHGTINLAIVGGFNNTVDVPGSGTDFEDNAGYQYGLGIAPFARLGSSRIFNPDWTYPNHTEINNAAYSKGARISSNSWGMGCSGCCPAGVLGQYDTVSQEYDYLVRDARPNTASDGGKSGNQEMVIVFSSGNEGTCLNEQLGNRGSTSKNTIVVGAGENWNQAGRDGCGVNNVGADNIRDVINFSSAGPTQDNRFKPDIMAPGTHIFGAASQDGSFDGSGVCGGLNNDKMLPPDDAYHPLGQTLYTWSSGTSHSTPAVAGACALLRQWFTMQERPTPSPAMTKAYLMNSATYMTGTEANDDLPSNSQGMGRQNLERSFDSVSRILVDQTEIFAMNGEDYRVSGNTNNSGEPFRVTLAWTDAPGNPISGVIQVNDLVRWTGLSRPFFTFL